MFGTGIGAYIPMAVYVGFWIMCVVSLTGRPLLGLYYMLPFLPYRTLRDHLLTYPLGANMLSILILCVIIGALLKGKRLPKSKLYVTWLIFGAYLYFSMWLGVALGNAPAPIWLSDVNFVTWKDYMVIPLVFVAAGLVVEDRKAVRMVLLITAVSLLAIDRSCILESLSRTWTSFDEDKRGGGPLAYGSNQTAAFLAQFGMLFWGVAQFAKRKKIKACAYLLTGTTLFAMMYTFSRGAYLASLVSVLVLGLLKDRKLLFVLGLFLVTWQSVVPAPVRERINMTQTANGQLEASAQERVDLWTNAETSIEHNPIVGTGFGTYQLGEHVDNLRDTHNWYVKVMVETGIIGLLIALALLIQMVSTAYRLFRHSNDPLYQGLGLGLILALTSCFVANFFGDRWTYLEITALLWVLVASATRANQLSAELMTESLEPVQAESRHWKNPYLASH
jgi:putative inorganic carbon (hco3(-)) transporter